MARHRRGYTGERYTELLGVKLTPTQRADLARKAEASGMQVSYFARAVLTGARMPKTGADAQTLRSLTAQMAHIGNNVNQLARIANQTGEIRHVAALEAVTAEIIATLRKVVGG